MPKRLPLLLCLLVLASCTQPRRRAEKVLADVGPENLREAAAQLYKNLFAAHGPGYFVLKDAQCPAQFMAFKPDHVGAYPDGFAIAIMSDNDMETGIYVVPAHSDLKPRVTPRRRYEPMSEGLYWYSFDR